MNMVKAIELAALPDDTLKALQIYWLKRLKSRGGSWLAGVLMEAARDMLDEIDQELQRREKTA